MRRLLRLEEHRIWKREFGFDRIELAVEMDEGRCRTSTGLVLDPFLYQNMMTMPRRPHTPDGFALEMRVDLERLRLEIMLSQPAPQCDPLPQRAAFDEGSEEPGTPPQSPAIDTRPDGLGVSRAETQTEEDFSPLKPAWMIFCSTI